MIKNHFIFDPVQKCETLNFYRLSDATFYDHINTIYQFIKPFLDKKCLFLRNMEPLNEIATLNVSVLPTQLMTADNFCWLKMFLVEAYKNYKN